MKKGNLEKFWYGVHLEEEEEEKEEHKIREYKKLQQELERRKSKTWNGSTEKNGEEK
jgi:hypothetical protein